MTTSWWSLLLVVACCQKVEAQSKSDNETCGDEAQLSMLERMLANPQQLRDQLQQLHQANQTCQQQIDQQRQQLQQDHQADKQQLHQQLQQLRQQLQTVMCNLDVIENSLNASQPPESRDCSNHNTVNSSTPRDCYEIYNKSGERSDGVYTVYPNDTESGVDVYCDMTTDGGGWTVFQRRQDGSVDFYLNWNDYRTGFGSLNGEFWLGNDNLHLMTSDRRQRLRVDLADWEGNTSYAEFNNFTVGSAQEKYRLASLGTYNGTAGDSLTSHHLGMKFSTKDQDNDVYYSSCATRNKGAWWYRTCAASNLNGHYYTGGNTSLDSVRWDHWRGGYSLKLTEMKIRPFYV